MEELLVDDVLKLLESDNDRQLRGYLNDLNISDVEHLIDELPQYAVKFIETLSIKRAVNVFRILDFPTQEKIIKKLQSNKRLQLTELKQAHDQGLITEVEYERKRLQILKRH